MPFFVDGNPTPGEISEALNYLLGNSQQTTSTDLATGQITDATGNVVSYLYKYLHIKYADSFDGSVNFTNSPTNRTYYGLRNTDDTIESTNPSDYIWTKATPPAFGTTYLFYYSVTGGRRIDTLVSMSAPSSLYQPDTGSPIDLDVISGSTGSDGNSARICYAKSTSTSLSSIPATYQTSGSSSFPPTNTWGGGETWQATPPSLAVNEALFQSNGIYNPTTDLTTWNSPYLSNLKVANLSVISADMGTITAGTMTAVTVNASTINGGTLSIGASPAISGTSMTGTGSRIYSDGRMVVGNSSKNMVFDGSNLTINGDIVSYGNINSVATGQIIAGSFNTQIFLSNGSFTVPAYVYKIKIFAMGGGGNGGNAYSTGSNGWGGGGGGGGGSVLGIYSVTPGNSYSISIGGAGSATTVSGPGISINAGGGAAGGAGSSTVFGFGGAGGGASGGILNLVGGYGSAGTPPEPFIANRATGGPGGTAAFIGTSGGSSRSAPSNSGGGGGGGSANCGLPVAGGSGGTGLVIIDY